MDRSSGMQVAPLRPPISMTHTRPSLTNTSALNGQLSSPAAAAARVICRRISSESSSLQTKGNRCPPGMETPPTGTYPCHGEPAEPGFPPWINPSTPISGPGLYSSSQHIVPVADVPGLPVGASKLLRIPGFPDPAAAGFIHGLRRPDSPALQPRLPPLSSEKTGRKAAVAAPPSRKCLLHLPFVRTRSPAAWGRFRKGPAARTHNR